MKKTKVVTKLIAIILSILVVVQVAPMSTFAETIETESEKFEESGYSTEVSQEEEDPIVIGEDVDRRDSSNTKYFKMSDGTIKAAVYKDPVLYQDSAGKWQEIDNTLETSDNENDELSNFNGYATKSNKFRVKFAKNSNQKKLVSIKMGDYSVSLSLLNKTKKNNSSMKQEKKAKIEDLTAASKASQKIYYENILPDTNIEYIVNGSGVKENIVIKSAQSNYQYSFEIDVKDLALTLEDDGCIYAKDVNTGKTVFVLPKPFMLDANYEYSDNVNYFYKKSDGTMIDEDGMGLTLTVPKTNNNNYYKISDDKGNVMWFNVAGAFARSLDSNSNQIANYYASSTDPKIWKVTDGADHALTISPTPDNLAVQSITDSAGRVTRYNWSSGLLLSIYL